MPKSKYILYSVILVVLLIALYVLKNKNEQDAFNSCVDNAETLRLAILDYRKTNPDYPDSLTQLDQSLMCGQRLFRAPLIRYEKLDGDFLLSFSDKFVTFKGSAEEPMTAFK